MVTQMSVTAHEIGHALGLSHPFSGYNIIGNINDSLDNIHSVMTYDHSPSLLGVNPMPMDMLAMEFIYGGSGNANMDDTTFQLDPRLMQAQNNGGYANARMSIVDDFGFDVINAKSINNGIFLNLAPGSWSNLSGTMPYLLTEGDDTEGEQLASSFDISLTIDVATDLDLLNYGQVYIESETYIENCDLTDYADVVFDNSADNIIRCEGGDDLVSISHGNDSVFGGAGYDEVSIFGSADDYTITTQGAGYSLLNINAGSVNFSQRIYLEEIEEISFYGQDDRVSFSTPIELYAGASDLPYTFVEVQPFNGIRDQNDMAYRAKLVDYGMENREVVFTDVDGVKHCVATSDDYGSRVTFSGIQAETLGNGKYVIVFAAQNDDLPGDTPDYYYRVFDTKIGDFDSDATFMGSADHTSPSGITNLDLQEVGRVLMYNDQYQFAEIRVDKNPD